MAIPKTQRAVLKIGEGNKEAHPEVREVDVPTLKPGQILVKVNYSGVCSSDKLIYYDEWADILPQPRDRSATNGIAGHEGAGIVVALADDVREEGLWKEGDRAGIKYFARVCGACDFCRDGKEVHCVKRETHLSEHPGTFQEYCAAFASYTTRIPDGVSDEEAGPLMCGGVTSYVACKNSQVKPGQWLVISGAGGGLGHLGLQYAKAMGMRVIALDGGDAKKELCLKLGAEEFIDFTKTKDVAAEVMRITTLGAHGVIIFASDIAYQQAPMFLRNCGTMVCVGFTANPFSTVGAPNLLMTLKALRVVGSLVGSLKDTDEALDFCKRGLVHPILTRGKLEDTPKFLEQIKAGTLPGRAVVKIAE